MDQSQPTRRARPAGSLGAEVWLTLTPPQRPAPPLNPPWPQGGGSGNGDGGAYTFLSVSSRGTPPRNLQADFPSDDAGEIGGAACYALRWVSTRGEKGPWSDITTATVAA